MYFGVNWISNHVIGWLYRFVIDFRNPAIPRMLQRHVRIEFYEQSRKSYS
jgi:hypothetical protein